MKRSKKKKLKKIKISKKKGGSAKANPNPNPNLLHRNPVEAGDPNDTRGVPNEMEPKMSPSNTPGALPAGESLLNDYIKISKISKGKKSLDKKSNRY